MKTKFSFDDSQIGRLRDTGRSIDPKTAIERPPGIEMNEWRRFASQIAKRLNEAEKGVAP